jgi:adenosylhomocysteine nucleosidase
MALKILIAILISANADYTTQLDLSWLPAGLPPGVIKAPMVSADKDLIPQEIAGLSAQYQAIAGDWESAAIAYVAQRNHKKVLILRGVTDLVGHTRSETTARPQLWKQRTETVMGLLLEQLPFWIAKCQ